MNAPMRKKQHEVLSIPKFAIKHGLPVTSVMDWIVRKTLTPPIVVYGSDGEPKIDETAWRKEFAA